MRPLGKAMSNLKKEALSGDIAESETGRKLHPKMMKLWCLESAMEEKFT